MSPPDSATVSIVIPCYRQAAFLPEAIESALEQTHRAEVIVVDDGSPDNAGEVARRYSGVRLISQANAGVAEARNAGWQASTGQYLIFLDADDRLMSNAVEAHLRCFTDNPGVGFVVGDIDHIKRDGSYADSPRWPILYNDFYQHLLSVDHVANTIAVMFRREVVEKVGGFEKQFSPAEDYQILLKATRCSRSAHHATVVAQYRRHESNTSRRGVVMLSAMRRVLDAERPYITGARRLRVAHRRGKRHWREHYGAVAIKEALSCLAHGKIVRAVGVVAGAVRYAHYSIFRMPWKYRGHALRLFRENFTRTSVKRAQ